MAHHKKASEAGVAKVRAVIAGLALAGTISLESAARQLDTSPRTLQRRLRQRGISFWILVEQSRFEISGALLRETDLKVQEIAARIGYATPSAFARAFTRWAGRSPTEYRNARAGRDHEAPEWREMGRSVTHQSLAVNVTADLSEEI